MSVTSVTLQTAILLVVAEFAKTGRKFSAHEITQTIRDKCNTGQMEIPEVEDLSGTDSYRFNVQHVKVRNLFNEMRDNGVFDSDYSIQKKFNGMFFEYFANPTTPSVIPQTPVTTPIAPVASPVIPPSVSPAATAFTIADTEIRRRVIQYLDNCKSRNFRPSLKQVQSAIKRGEKSTGVSSTDLLDLIRKDLGYSVSYGADIKNTQIIL